MGALRSDLMTRQLSSLAGLAVSGGSDSMAMLHLMARLAPEIGVSLQVVTLDHGLRPEAAEEAAFVAETCAGLGLPHQSLLWQDRPATGNLMQEGSRARYRLISAWAKAKAIPDVLLAHTADDQAETFLMGLSRAAGLDGLAGMRPEWQEDGIRFLRPLLWAERGKLRGYLTAHQLDWRDDPSNQDDKYTRARMRKAVQQLAPLGITVETLRATVSHLARSRALLRETLVEHFDRIGREEAGALFLTRDAYRELSPELRRQFLIAATQYIASRRHAPRAEAVTALDQSLIAGKSATLAGCFFRVTPQKIEISREAQAVTAISGLDQLAVSTLWDQRWSIEGPARPGAELRKLGAEGLRQLEGWRDLGLPRAVLLVSPGIWQGEVLLAAPLMNIGAWRARIVSSFRMFVLSH